MTIHEIYEYLINLDWYGITLVATYALVCFAVAKDFHDDLK